MDSDQNLRAQSVRLQAVAKAQTCGLVGQTGEFSQLGKPPVQRCIKGGFFHRRMRQREPWLHKVHPEHGLHRKPWPAGQALPMVWRNQLHQRSPQDRLFHPIQEFALAGFLHVEVEIEVQGCLFHCPCSV